MEPILYFGMDRNPFVKDISPRSLYQSYDFQQMTNRMDFLIKTKGMGIFLSYPGMGKTTCIRNKLESLNQNLYKVVYICLTTVSAVEIYRQINDALGLEDCTRKTRLFSQIKEEIVRLTEESKKEVIIVIDEVQYLKKDVLIEFIMLMNFKYDSRDYCTVIFSGQNDFQRTLKNTVLEAFKQRININYTFTGFTENEVREYIVSRLETVNCRTDVFTEESYHSLHSLMNNSIRNLNQIVYKSLIIATNEEADVIGSEIINRAARELL